MFNSSIVKLKKKDGKIYEFEAIVESDMIFTNNASLPIEVGDIIERNLKSNGLVEEYYVVNPQYFVESVDIPGGGPQIEEGHFQIKVSKKGTKEKSSSQTVNFYGDATFGNNAMIGNTITIGEVYIKNIAGITESDKVEILNVLEKARENNDISELKTTILPKILGFSRDVAVNVIAGIIMYFTGFQGK